MNARQRAELKWRAFWRGVEASRAAADIVEDDELAALEHTSPDPYTPPRPRLDFVRVHSVIAVLYRDRLVAVAVVLPPCCGRNDDDILISWSPTWWRDRNALRAIMPPGPPRVVPPARAVPAPRPSTFTPSPAALELADRIRARRDGTLTRQELDMITTSFSTTETCPSCGDAVTLPPDLGPEGIELGPCTSCGDPLMARRDLQGLMVCGRAWRAACDAAILAELQKRRTCPECRRPVRFDDQGLLVVHNSVRKGGRCDGSGGPPLAAEATS